MTAVHHFSTAGRKSDWWKDSIICGDCREVMKAMPEESVHLAITSPPYNVGLAYDGHDDSKSYYDYLAWLLPIWKELQRELAHAYLLARDGISILDWKTDTALQERHEREATRLAREWLRDDVGRANMG